MPQIASSSSHRASPLAAVVIPTYNRIDDLLTCLRHLESQTCRDFEVVIVDDGSTDDTLARLEAYRGSAPFPVRVHHKENGGPARARNFGIAHVTAPLSILIGDDIFPDTHFVQSHLDHHRNHPQLEAVAVGFTRWDEHGQTVTAFMRWLDRDGVQFAYGDLNAGVTPGWQHFYTSNLSFKTAYLRDNPFNEGFPKAAMEDIELGYRLASSHGLHMSYLPSAIARHRHPTTFRKACRRAIDAGAGAWVFAQLWPEQRKPQPASPIKRALLPLLTEPHVVLPVLRAATGLLTRLWCPNPLLLPVLMLHERLGYRQQAAGR